MCHATLAEMCIQKVRLVRKDTGLDFETMVRLATLMLKVFVLAVL
jgi:hypothetical protein